MRTLATFVCVMVLLFGSTITHASGIAIGLRPINTVGVTGELTTSIYKELINVRAGFNFFSFRDNGTIMINEETIGYDAGLELNSILVTLDWHPGGNHFRIAPGIYYNRNELSIDIFPVEEVSSGSYVLDPEEIGMVRTKLDYPDFAPYLGFGWGNAVKKGGRFRFGFDIGVLYLQSPTVKMEATKLLTPTAEQAEDLTHKMKDYNFWLVVSFGITFRLL